MTTNRRRSRSRSTARSQTRVQAAGAPAQPDAAGDAAGQMDWRQEYGYVLTDLRTLLIVSAILFGVIVVLGFVL